jgi:aerobic carbon-monoxide dehydrogenase medium subunit
MKSAAFDYVRAETPQQAFALLAQHGDDARILAGGQTLLATLNMRLSASEPGAASRCRAARCASAR